MNQYIKDLFNSYSDSIEIINRTELIINMVNNLFEKLNKSNIDNGIDEIIDEKNISIIITSTKKQKKK